MFSDVAHALVADGPGPGPVLVAAGRPPVITTMPPHTLRAPPTRTPSASIPGRRQDPLTVDVAAPSGALLAAARDQPGQEFLSAFGPGWLQLNTRHIHDASTAERFPQMGRPHPASPRTGWRTEGWGTEGWGTEGWGTEAGEQKGGRRLSTPCQSVDSQVLVPCRGAVSTGW